MKNEFWRVQHVGKLFDEYIKNQVKLCGAYFMFALFIHYSRFVYAYIRIFLHSECWMY